jgi:ATP-binding cassette subfamily F protein uup
LAFASSASQRSSFACSSASISALRCWSFSTTSAPTRGKARGPKLSYKEARELEALPKELEALEAEQHALAAKMSNAEYYKQGADVVMKDQQRSLEIETLLHAKLERWEALEAKQKAAAS